jgi:hypothetical protein
MDSIECSVGGLVYFYQLGYIYYESILCYHAARVKGIYPYFVL